MLDAVGAMIIYYKKTVSQTYVQLTVINNVELEGIVWVFKRSDIQDLMGL